MAEHGAGTQGVHDAPHPSQSGMPAKLWANMHSLTPFHPSMLSGLKGHTPRKYGAQDDIRIEDPQKNKGGVVPSWFRALHMCTTHPTCPSQEGPSATFQWHGVPRDGANLTSLACAWMLDGWEACPLARKGASR
jgi:hypothetical protein